MGQWEHQAEPDLLVVRGHLESLVVLDHRVNQAHQVPLAHPDLQGKKEHKDHQEGLDLRGLSD